MLEVGNGAMTLEEYRTQLSLWSILAAPLILGNDVRHMSAEIRELLLNAEVIAIDQDTLGQQGHRVVQRELVEVWVKPLASGALAVGLFNRSDGTKSIGIRWPELGLNGPQAVRDLWRRSDVGTLADRYDSDVPPHGSVLLRVTPAR
jgi:alpha-galactosidase